MQVGGHHRGVFAEDVAKSLRSALPPSITNRSPVGSRPRSTRSAASWRAWRSGRPTAKPEQADALVVIPGEVHAPGDTAVERRRAQRPAAGRPPAGSPRAGALRRRLRPDWSGVADEEASTAAPTGSPTRANLRVETPASVTIATRMNGSRSADTGQSRPAARASHRPCVSAAGGRNSRPPSVMNRLVVTSRPELRVVLAPRAHDLSISSS